MLKKQRKEKVEKEKPVYVQVGLTKRAFVIMMIFMSPFFAFLIYGMFFSG